MSEKIVYVHIAKAHKEPGLPDCGETHGRCPKCEAELQIGFGLAGGSYGAYEYCDEHGIITKSDERG